MPLKEFNAPGEASASLFFYERDDAMFGLEKLAHDLGWSTQMVAVVGYAMLLAVTIGAKVLLEIKNKDLAWNDIPGFLVTVGRYVVFLLGLEAVGMIFGLNKEMKEMFNILQVIGFAGCTYHCFRHLVATVGLLGLDMKAFNKKLDEIDPPTEDAPFDEKRKEEAKENNQ